VATRRSSTLTWLRPLLAAKLRHEAADWRSRYTGDAQKWVAEVLASRIDERTDQLDAGRPLRVWSWQLPGPWRRLYRPPV
jgi:hypothetical protein